MNKIYRAITLLLSCGIIAVFYINLHFLKNNMAYYRTMYRFDRDFNNYVIWFWVLVFSVLFVIIIIKRTHLLMNLTLILLELVIVINYECIDYLSNSVTVIVSSLFVILQSFLMLGIESRQNQRKLVLITYIITLYLLFNAQINELTLKLSSLDIESVRDYIASFGILAPLVSMLLMVLQSILAPIPAFLITFANALVFGWIKGAIISWSGAMIGAIICFYLARYLGRDVAIKYTGEKQLRVIDSYFTKYGKVSILVARLLPFVPFDPVSYAAGLTNIRFSSFVFATGLGQLPATIIYSYFAGNITSGARGVLWAMSAMFIITALVVTIKNRKE